MTRRTFADLPSVETFTVAPHRYLFNDGPERPASGYKAVREAAPYQPGEVAYAVDGDTFRRVYIVAVYAERDRYDDLREFYEVRPETKRGTFARRSYHAHPGYIQRGYQRAGLAPDVPADQNQDA